VKFTTVFILFNVVLVLFLAALGVAPVFLMGSKYLGVFWASIWPLALILLLVIVGFDVYFIGNRRLYQLLEKEDWPALAHYLEGQVITRARYQERLVKLLANTYIVLADPAAVLNLEAKTGVAKPAILEKNALVFGTARVLTKDYRGAAHFFEEREKSGVLKGDDKAWVRWYRGFSLMLSREYDEAARIFTDLSASSRCAEAAGLSAYFLDGTLSRVLPERAAEFKAKAEAGKARVRTKIKTREAWDREAKKLETEIYAAALAAYLDKAGGYLYESV
jgi:hypothetical protein